MITARWNDSRESLDQYMAKCNQQERQMGIDKETIKQLGKSHEAFKETMQRELDTVEARFSRVLHENTMMGEDFRS